MSDADAVLADVLALAFDDHGLDVPTVTRRRVAARAVELLRLAGYELVHDEPSERCDPRVW